MQVGIDFGAKSLWVARVDANGAPMLLADSRSSGQFGTPSLVSMSSNGALIGQLVEDLLEDNPDMEVVRNLRSHLGCSNSFFSHDVSIGWPPECLTALMLKKILRDACETTFEDVTFAVIGIPASFADRQREALVTACRLAELSDVRLIEKSIAGAIFFEPQQSRQEARVLVCDFDHDALEVSLVTSKDSVRGIAALAREPTAGGLEIEREISRKIGEEFVRSTGFDPWVSGAAKNSLRRYSQELIKSFFESTLAKYESTLMLGNVVADLVLTRLQFGLIVNSIVSAAIATCNRLLRSTGLDWKRIDKLILLGEPVLLPMLLDEFQNQSAFPAERIHSTNPHLAVVYGAALSANGKSGLPTTTFTDLGPKSDVGLGLRIIDAKTGLPTIKTVIPPNSEVPVSETAICHLNRKGQTRLVLEVVKLTSDSAPPISAGHVAVNLPSSHQKKAVEVILGFDPSRRITVFTVEPESGRRIEHRLEDSTGNSSISADPSWRQLIETTPLIY